MATKKKTLSYLVITDDGDIWDDGFKTLAEAKDAAAQAVLENNYPYDIYVKVATAEPGGVTFKDA